MKISIETERLILREVLPEDEDGFFELESNPNVHTYLGDSPVTDREQLKNVIQHIRRQYEENGIGRWAVTDKLNGVFMGWAGLKLIREEINGINNFYDLGYRLIEKYWGKGIATEAAKASADHAFNILGADVLYGMCDSKNKASEKVLLNTGLKFKAQFIHEGIHHDWFAVTKEEYNALRKTACL